MKTVAEMSVEELKELIRQVIADEAKRNLFDKRLQDEPFYASRHRFVFRSFEEVFRLYQLQVQLAQAQAHFFADRIRPRW